MTDYISMEKIWQDVFCYQVKITCASCCAVATNDFYTSDDNIDALFHGLNDFMKGKTNEFLWENGEKGDRSTACITLKFAHKDKLGHVLIETYMELDDGGVTVVTTAAFISIQNWVCWKNSVKGFQRSSKNH